MEDNKILTKLNEIASNETSEWTEEAKQRIAKRDWIEKSAKIAVRILQEIKTKKTPKIMSQRLLALQMGVSPQYVNKILKGQENLSLETISKIEKALGISLIEIPNSQAIQTVQVDFGHELFVLPKYRAGKVFARKPEPFSYADFNKHSPAEIRA